MEKEIRVLVIEPLKKPYEKTIPNTLKALQHEVGGLIEVLSVPLDYDSEAVIIQNEEGKINSLPMNRVLYDADFSIDDIICGTFLIVGTKGENFCSLTDKQIFRNTRLFEMPQRLMRFGNALCVLPAADTASEETD